MHRSKLSFCLAFLFLAAPLYAKKKELPPKETLSISLKNTFEADSVDTPYSILFQSEISYYPAAAKKKPKNKAYLGALYKKNEFYIDPAYLDATITSIVKDFKRNYNNDDEESFFKRVRYKGKKTYMLFYLKAFYPLLEKASKEDANITENESLLQEMRERYLQNVVVYLAKKSNQKQAANPYKLPGFILREIQPILATFIYADPFIALAEVYKSSNIYNAKTQKYYRGIFKKDNQLMVLRRSLHIPVDERRPVESLVKLTDDHMRIYMNFHILNWIDEERLYRLSKGLETTEKTTP